ncbi:MAG TPA: tail fiber domain-containing protein, partial [Flavobacteriales bacterium]|nr:tail fiber domain-containing protein [Flavobacteriales bacterium]
MFHTGTEFGTLYHLDTQGDFNIHATRGYLYLHTTNKLRVRVAPNLAGQTVNNYTGLDLSGFTGIGMFNGPPVHTPFSLLHLDHKGALDGGYRPWMYSGTTCTHFNGWMYTGLKAEDADRVHAVLNWGGNTASVPPVTPQALRFIYTDPSPGTNVASGLEGLEIARVLPDQSGNEGYFGIGDFASVTEQPLERLDVLNGRLRLRVLPDPSGEADGTFKLIVVDASSTPSPERGVVKWVDPATFGECASGWHLVGNNTCTAWDGNLCVPQSEDLVGVGTNAPLAKLDVLKDVVTGTETAVRGTVTSTGATGYKTGVEGSASGGSGTVRGVAGIATSGGINMGTVGLASGGSIAQGAIGAAADADSNIGTDGYAVGGNLAIGARGVADGDNTATWTVGVWGESSQALSGFPSWAGYFNGPVFGTGGLLTPSDENLKSNIEDITDGLEKTLQIEAKTFQYDTAGHPSMHLPGGEQSGFMAQQLESVLPHAVMNVSHPPVLDSLGNVVIEEVQFKAIRTETVVPYLIGAIQQLNQKYEDLLAQVEGCCGNAGMQPQGQDRSLDIASENLVRQERLLITPNPFTDHATIRYFVAAPAKVSLQVNDNAGQSIGTIREEQA